MSDIIMPNDISAAKSDWSTPRVELLDIEGTLNNGVGFSDASAQTQTNIS